MSDQLPSREVIASPPWCLEHDAQVIEGPVAHQFDECWKQIYAEGSVELCRVVSDRLVDRKAINWEAAYAIPLPAIGPTVHGIDGLDLVDYVQAVVAAAIGDIK